MIKDVLAVTIRAQCLKQNKLLDQADKLSGAVPMALDAGDPKVLSVEDNDTTEVQALPITDQTVKKTSLNTELQGIWMTELDNSIFETSKVRANLQSNRNVTTAEDIKRCHLKQLF